MGCIKNLEATHNMDGGEDVTAGKFVDANIYYFCKIPSFEKYNESINR